MPDTGYWILDDTFNFHAAIFNKYRTFFKDFASPSLLERVGVRFIAG
jgi:hypothetical protein